MAALGAGELHARWRSAKELLATGVVTMGVGFPAREDDLCDDVALKWRARTKAAEMMTSRVPDRHGIGDSFLNVALRRIGVDKEGALEESDAALGYLASFTAARSAANRPSPAAKHTILHRLAILDARQATHATPTCASQTLAICSK